jgi:dihydroorotase
MAKFLHLGLTLPQVIALTTTGPASSAGLATPALVPGAPADLAVLEVVDRETELIDATRKGESARQSLRAEWTVVGGRAIRSGEVPLVVRPLLEADLELLRPPES